jgi:hypothetical protein
VEAQLHPRFPVCGGWTSDWDQGYQVPSKYYLSQGKTDREHLKLVMPILHAYEQILAQEYTVSVTLPSGANDIKVSYFFSRFENRLISPLHRLKLARTRNILARWISSAGPVW